MAGDCKPQIPDQFMDDGVERTEWPAGAEHLYGVIMIMVLVSLEYGLVRGVLRWVLVILNATRWR